MAVTLVTTVGRLSELEAHVRDGGGGGSVRSLQARDECLDADDLAMTAVTAAMAVQQAHAVLLNATAALELEANANASSTAAALTRKADQTAVDVPTAALAAQLGSAPPAEVTPCSCVECPDEPIGGDLCAPYGSETPCDCVDSSGSTDPVRQVYPMTQSSPACCRPT